MSILDYINITSNETSNEGPSGPGHSLSLGETMPNFVLNESITYEDIYNFSSYDYAITISPKGSPIFRTYVKPCDKCKKGDIVKDNISTQWFKFVKLFDELEKQFKINFVICFEYYKDKQDIHCHGILRKSIGIDKRKIINYINNYFKVDNYILCDIREIGSFDKWCKYIIKDQEIIDLKPFVSLSHRDKKRNKERVKDREYVLHHHLKYCINKNDNCLLCEIIGNHLLGKQATTEYYDDSE